MPELIRDDVALHYEVDGSGPPLLLLSGMLSDSATWAPLLPLLPDYTIIRIDNRATGRTAPWNAPVDMSRMVADTLAVMDALGHETFHIAGHSMGGLMALELAAIAPDRLASVTVLASGRLRLPRIAGIFDALIAVRDGPDGERLWLRALYPFIFGSAFFEDPNTAEAAVEAALAYPYAQSLDAMKHQVAMFRQLTLVAQLEEINTPVQVAYGAEDILVPPDMARPSFQGLPNLTEHTIAGAGHSIVWDAPETVANLIADMVAKHAIQPH